jgi:hypothetical protein
MLQTQSSTGGTAHHPPERRAGERRAVRIGVTVFAGDESDAAHSLDLGVGGVRLLTAHRLCAGARPTLVVPLPGGPPVMASAEVLETSEGGEGWVCRLAFCGLRPLELKRLRAFVDGPTPDGDRTGRLGD